MLSELDFAIAACVGQDSDAISVDESAAFIELKHQIEIRSPVEIEQNSIFTSTSGLALPSWVPRPIQEAIGEEKFRSDKYVPIPDLIHDAVQSRRVDNLKDLAAAIARMPATSGLSNHESGLAGDAAAVPENLNPF